MAHPMGFGWGLLLQIVGMLVVVIAAFRTSGRMSKFSGGATYENMDSFLKTMANELRGGFVVQGFGFILSVAGMALQAWAALAP